MYRRFETITSTNKRKKKAFYSCLIELKIINTMFQVYFYFFWLVHKNAKLDRCGPGLLWEVMTLSVIVVYISLQKPYCLRHYFPK